MVKGILDRKILSIYEKRYSEYTGNAQNIDESTNIVDLCVNHNKRCEKNGLTHEILSGKDIIGDLSFFMFAGLDTSLQASTNCILH